MDAKDFRIGNLITRNDLGTGEPRIETIIELRRDKVFTSGPVTVICDYEDLNPVPLTDELLLKLGFTQDGDEYSKDNFIVRLNRRDLVIEGFEYDYNGITVSTEYFYIHDLQNLYFAIKRQELICEN